MHKKSLQKFIEEKKSFFWWIRDPGTNNVNVEMLVEGVLNYGDENDVAKLIALLGIENVAKIFHRQIARKRSNYSKRTIHYFKLYFQKHA